MLLGKLRKSEAQLSGLFSLLLLCFVLPFLLIPSTSYADLCNAFDEVGRNADMYDPAVWDDLAKLDPDGITQDQIDELLATHRKTTEELTSNVSTVPDNAQPQGALATPVGTTEVILGNRARSAQRSLMSATRNVRENVEEFIETASRNGIDSIREMSTQRGWNLKTLHSNHQGRYSVRMNGGYRVLFEPLENGSIHILDMGTHVTH